MLFNKYRPKTFDEIKGNDNTVQVLKSKLEKNDLARSILFSGPHGCGKTTLARILAAHLNETESGLIEINCANDTSVDSIRSIIQQMKYLPLEGDSRIWILDEVHRLTAVAQSALLKPLEEPPNYVYFFLCTTEPNKLLNTIRSRCMEFSVVPLKDEVLLLLLKTICRKEKKRNVPKETLEQIVLDSRGHPRDAIVILDKIINLPVDRMEEAAKQIAEEQNEIISLCRALIRKRSWKEITTIINGIQDEPEKTRRAVLGYCNAILSKKDDPYAFLIMDAFKSTFYYTGVPGLRMACYEALASIKE